LTHWRRWAAAHDGRLRGIPGFGARRVAVVRNVLADLLGRIRTPPRRVEDEPSVAILLDVDREYRDAAARGALRKIAPKRFNPGGEVWLPVLHTTRGHWQFTALYSNTARAHELQRTGDWVVIYFHRDGSQEGRRTIVTETQGPGAGQRIVPGRRSASGQPWNRLQAETVVGRPGAPSGAFDGDHGSRSRFALEPFPANMIHSRHV